MYLNILLKQCWSNYLLSFFITTQLIYYRGDGSCKHAVALLFGIIDHITSMEDRSSIGVTDTAVYWDKPRTVCRPVPVHDLDMRYATLFLNVLFLGLSELPYFINIANSTVFFWLHACIVQFLIPCQSFYSYKNQANLAE